MDAAGSAAFGEVSLTQPELEGRAIASLRLDAEKAALAFQNSGGVAQFRVEEFRALGRREIALQINDGKTNARS